MVHFILRRLKRERRRAFVIALCVALAGFISTLGWGTFYGPILWLDGLPFPLVSMVAFSIFITPLLISCALLFQPIRHVTEIVAIGLPLFIAIFGGSAFTGDGIGMTATVFSLMVLLFAQVYGPRILNRFFILRDVRFQTKISSALAPAKLWAYCADLPDLPVEDRDENTLSIDWIQPGKTFVETIRLNGIGKIEEEKTILMSEPPNSFANSYKLLDAAPNVYPQSGSFEVNLFEHSGRTHAVLAHRYDQLPLLGWFRMWIDDACGRQSDRVVRRAELREREKTQ